MRLPLDSSIAVVKLKGGQAAASAAQACSCSTAPCLAGVAGAAAAAGHTCSGTFDLDAMGTRLLVHAPDACHTFVQKPGHYKVRTPPVQQGMQEQLSPCRVASVA